MWIYLICFFSSILLLYISNKTKFDIYKKIIILIALLLPCILAGARSLEIGTDVNVYVTPMYINASNSNTFLGFLNSKIQLTRSAKDFEIGFSFMIYIITHFFHNIHIILFTIESLIIFPLYFGIKKLKPLKNQMWYVMLIYYFLFYNQGLNAMRQFISISFCIYGICSILAREKKAIIKYIVSLIIAFLFHKSSLISLSLIFIYFILNRKSKNQKYITYEDFKISTKTLLSITIIMIGFYIIFNMSIINNFLYAIDGMERYTMYTKHSVSLLDFNIIKILPILFIFCILLKKFYKKYKDSLFFIVTFCFAYIIFGQLLNVAKFSSRISILYSVFSCITYPLLTLSPNTNKGQKYAKIYIFIYVIFYWWYMYAFRGYSQTIPYILGL